MGSILLAATLRDGGARAGVGVGLCARLAVVVGGPPLRARHCVPLQRPVAYVLRRRQHPPVHLRVHVELPVLLGHALRDRPHTPARLGGGGRGDPGEPVAAAGRRGGHGEGGGNERCEEEDGEREERRRGHFVIVVGLGVGLGFWFD